MTLFQLRHEIDTGDIIAASACPIEPEDDFGTLYDKLMALGAELLAHGLSLLMQHDGCYPQALPQEEHPDPLSYTHLDVYKRQPLHHDRGTLPAAGTDHSAHRGP